MKKILIAGDHSYIGESLRRYLEECGDGFQAAELCMTDGTWKEHSFAPYDAVVHVAGIAHVKETDENRQLYYQVNRDLAEETARKAKTEGVGQFIFMSSMSVYGLDEGVIRKETEPHPVTAYGKSKLEGEEKIRALEDDSFRVCVLRPPMVYGKDCKGNFQSLIRLADKLPLFPAVRNERSIIYIDHLCEFIRLCLNERLSGLYFPQNREYMSTDDMARWILEAQGKKYHGSRVLGAGVKMLRPIVPSARKGFGSLVYQDTEEFDFRYCSCGAEESVRRSV